MKRVKEGRFTNKINKTIEDDEVFETINEEDEAEEVIIPDSEWKKVFGYIEQGSDFKKVGAACKRNPDKLKSRYLILKALGFNRSAEDFLSGASIGWSETKEYETLPVPEVPTKYADRVADKDKLASDYSKQKVKFAKRSMAGPLKELAQMGITFFTLYPDGSGRDQQKVMDVLGFIPKWRQSSTGLEFRNGRRWDVAQSIIMVNGETIKGDKWFEFVDHTNEGVDSPSYGYDVGFAGDRHVGADEVSSNTVREWIRENVKLVGNDDSITSSGKFVINTPYNGFSFTIDHDGFSISENLSDAKDPSTEESVRNIIFPKVKEIVKEKFGVENIGVLSGVVLAVEINKCMVDTGTGEFKTFDGNEGKIVVGKDIGYDPRFASRQMQTIKENSYFFTTEDIRKGLDKMESAARSTFIEPLPGKYFRPSRARTFGAQEHIYDRLSNWHNGGRAPNLKATDDEKLGNYWWTAADNSIFKAEKEAIEQEFARRGLRPRPAFIPSMPTTEVSESTKVTLTFKQLKKLVKEAVVNEDYWEDQYDKRLDAEAAYDTAWEQWAEDRYDAGAKGQRELWDNDIGMDDLEKKVSLIFSKSPGLKYKLEVDFGSGDPYYIDCTITAPDGFIFVIDDDSVFAAKVDPDGSVKFDHYLTNFDVAKYFAGGEDDIKELQITIATYEADADEAWRDAPKKSDEFDYDSWCEDDRDWEDD